MYLVKGNPNPNGAQAELFLLVGNATNVPVHTIEMEHGLSLPPAPPPSGFAPVFRLKLLHFNDLHGHISHFTPYENRPVFSRIVSHIRELRQQCRKNLNLGLLVLSAGDDLVGSLFDELIGYDPARYVSHVGYQLYSQAGVDVATIGNHDLDWGLDVLACAIQRDARFPILAANLVTDSDLNGLYYPAAIFVLRGIRIGIIGLTTPAELHIQRTGSFSVTDPIQTVQNLLPSLRPLCDIVIILSHLGRNLESHSAVVRGAGDVELARSLLPGSVNLIIGGHTHQALNEYDLTPDNIVNGIPITQAGALGRFLGEITLTLRGSPDVTHAKLTLVDNLPVDQEFEGAYVKPFLEKIKPIFSQILGVVANHPDLTSEAVLNDLATGESALANFVTDALVSRCCKHGYAVDFAMIDSSCLHTGLPVGQALTFADWFNVMPFADTIEICQISGYQLAQLLQDNAYRIDRFGEPQTERGFAHFSRQIRYTIRLGANISQAKVEDATVDGVPLQRQLERTFLLATTSFFRELSRAWESQMIDKVRLFSFEKTSHHCEATDLFLRNEMIAYIREHGGVLENVGAVRDGRLKVIG